jgi:hypothetical protein
VLVRQVLELMGGLYLLNKRMKRQLHARPARSRESPASSRASASRRASAHGSPGGVSPCGSRAGVLDCLYLERRLHLAARSKCTLNAVFPRATLALLPLVPPTHSSSLHCPISAPVKAKVLMSH